MRRLSLGLFAFASACGARSALPDGGGGEGGSGPSGSTAQIGVTTATTTATTSGEGGGGVCSVPTVRAAAVLLEPYLGMPAHDAALFMAGDSTVVAARFTSGSPLEPDLLGHLAWDPWGAWPPQPTDPKDTNLLVWATPPVFSSSPTGTFAVSLVDSRACDQWLGVGLQPAAQYTSPEGYPDSQIVGQGCSRVPRAVVGDLSGARATATSIEAPGPDDVYLLETAHVTQDGPIVSYEIPGCGGLPLYGDIEVVNDEFVIAASNATDQLGCNDPTGYPANVVVGLLGSGDPAFTVATTDDVAGIELIPRPGGLWLLYRESGASALTPPAVIAVRLDAELQAIAPPFEATSSGLGRFAATPLSDGGFVIVSDESSSEGLIWLRKWGPSGELYGEVTIPASGDAQPDFERLSVLASPDRSSAVVAWTTLGGRVFAARVDCLPEPPI